MLITYYALVNFEKKSNIPVECDLEGKVIHLVTWMDRNKMRKYRKNDSTIQRPRIYKNSD